jgi:hypothetical protein
MSTDFVTLSPTYNGDSVPLVAGMITRLKAGVNNNVVRAKADSAPNIQGLNGIVLSGSSAPGGLVTVSSVGRTSVQMESGLTLSVNQTVYVSPNVAGAGTNVQPANVAIVGVIADVSNYVARGTVIIDVIVGAGGSSGGGGAQGAQGATGATGAQGFQGATGSGAQGAQGATGAQGFQGGTGTQGAQGFQGSTANVLAGAAVVATSNLTLTGAATIDGVTATNGMRVLAAAQTDPTQNGIYAANTGGAWTRTTDFATAGQMTLAAVVPVYSGTLFAGSEWMFTTTGAITVGTTPLTFLQVGPPSFGSDTVLKLPNASATLVTALELIASLSTNTPGSEVSQWLIKLLSAGAQISAYVLKAAGLTVPNGSTAVPSVNFAGDPTSGMYHQGTNDHRLIDAGTGVLKWSTSGIFNLITGGVIAWANGVGIQQGGPSNGNIILSGQTTGGDVQVGAAGALATTATLGFLDMPTCAGTPTGVPTGVSTGKVAWVYDTSAHKIWVFDGGAWKATAALS